MAVITSWSALEAILEPIKQTCGPRVHADVWRSCWYVWTTHKNGILAFRLPSTGPLRLTPFSNERFDNRLAWSCGRLIKWRFCLDGVEYPSAEAYYEAKHREYGIRESVLTDKTKWWLNGHLLCNTNGQWSVRGLSDLDAMLSPSVESLYGPGGRYNGRLFVCLLNRRDFPQQSAETSMSPHWPVLGPLPETPLFYGRERPVKTLSFYGGPQFSDLLMPCVEHFRLLNDRQVWSQWPKKPQAVFRGTLTGAYMDLRNPRLQLVALSHCRPDLLDAGLTAWSPRCRVSSSGVHELTVSYQGDPTAVAVGLKAPLTPEQQSRYAVLVYAHGHVASMRLLWHLLSGSAVVAFEPPHATVAAPQMWFHNEAFGLKEGVHYIKCSSTEALEATLRSLLADEGAGARAIGHAGRLWAEATLANMSQYVDSLVAGCSLP